MNSLEVNTNSAKAWLLASRPKTLTGAAVPVCIALSLTYAERGTLIFTPALLCLLFAFCMQINANFINDYFDFTQGIDREDRLGPERACSQGWITQDAMKKGILATILLSVLAGLPLILWGGWTMILVGLACIVFSYLYTTLLSRRALGDVLVLLFFGIVPVCATYYLQTGHVTPVAFLLSLGCGFATDNLLIVNNFRDRDTDKRHGKTTLVTLVGERTSLLLYIAFSFIAMLLACVSAYLYARQLPMLPVCLSLAYFLTTCVVWQRMRTIRYGKALNQVLGQTSLTILMYGLAVSLSFLIAA